MNDSMMPYAHFLEEFCRSVAENQPESIVVSYRDKQGTITTGYFGEANESVSEKAAFAFSIQTDAMMQVVLANADEVKRRAEEIEAEEDGDQ